VEWVRIDLLDKGPGAAFRVNMADGRRVRVDGFYSDAVVSALRRAEVRFWVRTNQTPTWANLLISWAPFLLLIGFWVFFMAKVKSGGTGIENARRAVVLRPDKDWPRTAAPLSGSAAAALAELRTLVSSNPPAAVLLAGPSGSGKTHLLRALATDPASPCLLANGASFAEIFLGIAAARVRDLFAEGRKQAVAFIAIDGIDDICHVRTFDSRGDRDERTQAMLQLATCLDELGAPEAKATPSWLRRKSRPGPRLGFVGITSRADLIDPAILQRFTRVVALGPPDAAERASILTSLLPAGVADGLDLQAVVSRTEGWTRGDLRSCVDDAVRVAGKRDPSAEDLHSALAAREQVRALLRANSA
jgi:cell division protease FtsH